MSLYTDPTFLTAVLEMNATRDAMEHEMCHEQSETEHKGSHKGFHWSSLLAQPPAPSTQHPCLATITPYSIHLLFRLGTEVSAIIRP